MKQQFDVGAVNIATKKVIVLYEFIKSFDDAYLLAQLEMSRKSNDELIIIFPGYNIGIKNIPDMYEKALELAEKYRVDKNEDK